MLGLTVVILLSLGAIGGGALVWIRTAEIRGLPSLARVLLALVPMSGAAVMYLIIWTFFNAPTLDWNGGKLAPILALVKADQPDERALYHEPHSGVMTAWIYGPVPALLFLPAAVASRPTNAIFIALFINFCLYFGPALWAHVRIARMPIPPLDPSAPPTTSGTGFAMFTFLLFIWITMVNESMCRAALMIAPDAPTLGLAISSIVLLFYRRKPVVLVGAALCAVLACWCKQSAIPFLFVAPLYILIADGLIAAISYVLILAIVGAVTSTALLLSFGPFNMQFHMMQLPAAHGWENEKEFSRLQLFFRAVLALIQELLPTLGLIAFTLLVRHLLLPKPTATVGSRQTRIIAWARANPWLMFVIAAVFLLPSALLGFLKVGGYVNNFSLTHTFVLLTAMTLLMRLYAQIRSLLANASSVGSSMAFPIAPTHVCTIVLCLIGLLVMLEWPKVLLDPKRMSSTYRTIARPWDNQQEKIYDFAQANPGIVYFPWNTLSTLLAERRLYHFEWGLHDRYEADITPSDAQIRAHIPPKIRYVAYGPFHQGEETHGRWFAHWTAKVADERLEGFTIYTQPPQQSPPTDSRPAFDLTPR